MCLTLSDLYFLCHLALCRQLFEARIDEAKSFIKNIESKLQVSVTLIGTGPLVDDVIDIRSD